MFDNFAIVDKVYQNLILNVTIQFKKIQIKIKIIIINKFKKSYWPFIIHNNL